MPGHPVSFGARLTAARDLHGPLCVGIDPHPGLLAAWSLPDDAAGARAFGLAVVDALAGRVAALKPQSAFYERHGPAGIAALADVLEAASGRGTQVILDAKRGDIGSTMTGYADAYLRSDSPFVCDALTVSPFLGVGSLEPAVSAALESGRGLFVLALTSNPEGPQVQHAVDGSGVSVAASIVRQVAERNAVELAATGSGDPTETGSIGLVVGATVGGAVRSLGIDLRRVRGPLLAPGVGAQGGGRGDLEEVFGDARRQVLASVSRSVLGAGPDPDELRRAADAAIAEAAAALY
jgi:orotidine-5'-phosphate decarboxylase